MDPPGATTKQPAFPRHTQRSPSAALYINHSCDPNIAIQGEIVFAAIGDIAPNEELMIDWATTDDLDYEVECKCGSPNCRRTVTGKDWLKKELPEK